MSSEGPVPAARNRHGSERASRRVRARARIKEPVSALTQLRRGEMPLMHGTGPRTACTSNHRRMQTTWPPCTAAPCRGRDSAGGRAGRHGLVDRRVRIAQAGNLPCRCWPGGGPGWFHEVFRSHSAARGRLHDGYNVQQGRLRVLDLACREPHAAKTWQRAGYRACPTPDGQRSEAIRCTA